MEFSLCCGSGNQACTAHHPHTNTSPVTAVVSSVYVRVVRGQYAKHSKAGIPPTSSVPGEKPITRDLKSAAWHAETKRQLGGLGLPELLTLLGFSDSGGRQVGVWISCPLFCCPFIRCLLAGGVDGFKHEITFIG